MGGDVRGEGSAKEWMMSTPGCARQQHLPGVLMKRITEPRRTPAPWAGGFRPPLLPTSSQNLIWIILSLSGLRYHETSSLCILTRKQA
jgi:hypothetical protein